MASDSLYLCPVCGFLMDCGPADYNICSCCSTEFGLSDQNATIEELRQSWISAGMPFVHIEEKPDNFNPYQQLARLYPQSGTSTENTGDLLNRS